ncbi:MAG: endonuclease III [Candidatus Omnitrophica bacterium]|nr:endonuclease III [Candidatus Omnitrophota bacterium]
MRNKQKTEKVLALVEKAYGRPAPLRKTPPIDEIIRTILSQNTNDRNSLAAFAILKRHFKSWESLLKADTSSIAGLIKHAGLANIKAARIKEVLSEIERREGRLSLSSLKKMDVEDALLYLRSLKGVGPKTAACVLLFSFGKPAMPVDTHIFRVAKRMGLLSGKVTVEQAHSVLTKLVPKHLIYAFHLGIIEHGRKICKAQNPLCGFCVLYNMCRYKDKAIYRARKTK